MPRKTRKTDLERAREKPQFTGDLEFKAEILRWARIYIDIALGWLVIPLHSIDANEECTCGAKGCSDAGKHPRLKQGLKGASKDREQIEKWFGPDAPLSNIAIVTGERSGISILDLDTAKGKLGAESWAEATREKGCPETLTARTGSDGRHVVFSYISTVKTASNVLGKGIDSRNDGGYVVAAPSRHRTGGVYSWENWGTPLAYMPEHLATRKENRGRPRKDDHSRQKYTIGQVAEMLEVISPDDRDLWRNVGIILGREFNRSEEAWKEYVLWADRWKGLKGRGHDEIMHEAFYEISQKPTDKELTLGTIVELALENGWVPKEGAVPIEDLLAYAEGNNFIYRPTRKFWTAEAVNYSVSPVNVNGQIVKPSDWLRRNRLVTSLTKTPSFEEDFIRGVNCVDGEILPAIGAAVYNLYIRPTVESGDQRLAQPFVDHVRRLFNKPGDADQFLDYMAHRAQKPAEKPRFALLIAGGQGIGKDTAIEFCLPTIGAWNVANIEPSAFDAAYNEYAAATLVRISEAANLHETSKFVFNERTKVLIAGSPDACTINPKYGHMYTVKMHCGVVFTTNHLATGIYIPPDDRRYDVIDCATKEEMGLADDSKRADYFAELWNWFNHEGGAEHVAAFLRERDISKFSASLGQRKTDAHQTAIQDSSTDGWLEDILDKHAAMPDMPKDGNGRPKVMRGDWIINKAVEAGEVQSAVLKKMAGALDRAGYVRYPNPNDKERGRYRFTNKKSGRESRVVVYVLRGSPFQECWFKFLADSTPPESAL